MSIKIPPKRDPLDVVAIAYDGLCTFEFGVAVEMFGLPRPELPHAWYRFAVAATEPGPLRATGGISVSAGHGPESIETAGTIVVPGWRGVDAPVPEALIEALRTAHTGGARVLSLCSGVFVLAAAGLLDGRRATTHWRYADALAARYPRIQVDPAVLYVDEGQILTAAGSAAGIDLCLHLVRRDFGPRTANAVARRLVVPPHREGGQAQFVDRPIPPPREGQRLSPVFDLMRSDPSAEHSLASLARQVAMSERTFLRRFKAATGTSPADWLAGLRLARAMDLLESTDLPIEAVAAASGFGSAHTLRHHFRVRYGTSPAVYRDRFQGEGGPVLHPSVAPGP